MYRDEFLRLVEPLNESEQIYKRLYELRDDHEARAAYLSTIPMATIHRLALFVPEYTPVWHETMPEVDFLFARDTDVAFQKHHCYTPEFIHSHTYFEIIYVYSGTCVNKVGSTTLNMRTGDILLYHAWKTALLGRF